MRYRIPLFREEYHNLNANNPVFDYSTVQDAEGRYVLSPRSTLISSRIVRSGWLRPFIYKLYDSYQVIGIKRQKEGNEFEHLTSYGFTMDMISPEKFPTFKKWLRMKRNDEGIPKRFVRESVQLPDLSVKERGQTNRLKQPVEFLDELRFLNIVSKDGLAGGGGGARLPQAAKPLLFWERNPIISGEKTEFSTSDV